jgi:hypothetical protein
VGSLVSINFREGCHTIGDFAQTSSTSGGTVQGGAAMHGIKCSVCSSSSKYTECKDLAETGALIFLRATCSFERDGRICHPL